MTAETGRTRALSSHRYRLSAFFLRRLLQFALRWKRDTRFERLQLMLDQPQHSAWTALESQKTILILCNHLGFWDPFFIEDWVHRQLPHHTFHPLMLESEWNKRSWLSQLGVLPFNPQNPISTLRLLQSLKALQSDPTPRVFLIFPQGQFESHRTPPAHTYKAGWVQIAKSFASGVVLPGVLDYSHSSTDRLTPWLALAPPTSLESLPEASADWARNETERLSEWLMHWQEQQRRSQRSQE
jgi:1-acyl-sn-glycerol-3-phosphate acyltransferase